MNLSWMLESISDDVLTPPNYSSPSLLEPTSRHDVDSQLDEVLEHVFPLYLRLWVSIITGIIFCVGVGGNVMVPILIWKSKQLRHSTNIFLLNLAVADVLVLVICLPTALVELHTMPNTWILGSLLCQLVPFIEICVSRASILTLTVISVERYIAICKPLKASALCTRPRALGVCLFIWPISVLAAGPVLAATEFEEILHENGHIEEACMTSLHKSWVTVYYLCSVGIFSLLPLLFLSTIYFLISRKLLSQRARSRKKTDNSNWKARKQVAAMLRAVVVIFFVCLLPFQIFTVWILLSPSEHINFLGPHVYFNILFACRVLIYINSAVNPIIYNVMSAKFRAAFFRLLGLPSKWTAGSLRRQSTLTSSSFLSSSSFRRRASFLLQRSFSDAAFKRGRHQNSRSASFASVLKQSDSFRSNNIPSKERAGSLKLGKKLRSREKFRVGAYFSSGSHSNCSSITDIHIPLTPLTTPRALRYANHLLEEPSGFFYNRNSSLPSMHIPSPGTLKRVSFKNDRVSHDTNKRPLSPLVSKDQVPMIKNYQTKSGIKLPKRSGNDRLVKNETVASSDSNDGEEGGDDEVEIPSQRIPKNKITAFNEIPQYDDVVILKENVSDKDNNKEKNKTEKGEERTEEEKSHYFTKLKAITYSFIHLLTL